jgi:hypothetical protein
MDVTAYLTLPQIAHWDDLPLEYRRKLMYSTVGAMSQPSLGIPMTMMGHAWASILPQARPMDRPIKPQEKGPAQTKVFENRRRPVLKKSKKPEYL